MSAFTFTRPGNLIGSGFLIIYGGVPQLSIAWNGTREPERISLQNAIGEGFDINGKPASRFHIVSQGDSFMLEEKQEEPAADQNSDTSSELDSSDAS